MLHPLDEVRKVAQLSRIELSEAELVTMQQQFSAILDYVAQLNEIDTTGVDELAHPLPVVNVFRPDEPSPSLPVDAVLQNAPRRIGDYFGVPAVFDSDEPISH